MIRIHQLVDALDMGDAVSSHVNMIHRRLLTMGFSTQTFSLYHHPKVARQRRPIQGFVGGADVLTLYHFSGASELLPYFERARGIKVMLYHNVTPPEFFRGYSSALYDHCLRGRLQLKSLSSVANIGLGDSEFNRQELVAAGFRRTGLLPICVDAQALRGAPWNTMLSRRLRDGRATFLFVGRIAPNKKIEDLLQTFAHYHRELNPHSKFLLVGKTQGLESYLEFLHREVRRLGLQQAISFLGSLSQEDLYACYRTADLYLCLSEHEGFCVPLLEAMAFDLPVLAYRVCAIAETMGGAGLLFPEKQFTEIAEVAHLVLSSPERKAQILEGQQVRLAQVGHERLDEALRTLLEEATPGYSEETTRGRPTSSRRFSLVICTYNRGAYLERCLAHLGKLSHPNFEVVVVNGPSTDDTEIRLRKYPEVKVVRNPQVNLSVSRNLGIAAAAGEIIAFLDDDAIPEEDWLGQLEAAFEDPRVAGVGGKVIGPGGDHLQFANGYVSIFGRPTATLLNSPEYNVSKGKRYNILMGTNAAFRKQALLEIGGFDENIEYYHDEADLCTRLIKVGYRIEHHPEAFVWHEFAKSHVRKTTKDLNWFYVVKNTLYFSLKNSRGVVSPFLRYLMPFWKSFFFPAKFIVWTLKGDLTPAKGLRMVGRWLRGLAVGYYQGLFLPPKRHLEQRRESYGAPVFQSFHAQRRTTSEKGLRITLLSQGHPLQSSGGVATYTRTLAEALTQEGHEVHVLTRDLAEREQDQGGYFLHRVRNGGPNLHHLPLSYRVSRKNLRYALSISRWVGELHRRFDLQIVESPIWDAEGLFVAAEKGLPVVVRLQTPLLLVAESQKWPWSEDLNLACNFERTLIEKAQGVIAISQNIKEIFASRYGVNWQDKLVEVIPLGLPVPPRETLKYPEGLSAQRVRVLFLGRLERRKGIDTLLAAIPLVLSKQSQTEFILAGEDEGKHWERQLPGSFGRNVHFLGAVKESAKAELYRDCDLFVAPSRYESFGLIYLEAMAWAKPVVGCAVGGIPEIVEHGKTGLLVPPGDPEALADAILTFCEDPGLRENMGRVGRQVVEERFTPQLMARRSVAFYEKVLAGASSSH